MSSTMAGPIRRIAVNAGGGYVPGLSAVSAGVVMAAHQLGVQVVAIRDGYEGLLFRDRYADGGLTPLSLDMIDGMADVVLIGSGRVNPFKVRTDVDGYIEELDRSEEVLATLAAEGIDAVVSVAGRQPMSVVWKLATKGLRSMCVPVSVENDVAATKLAFGYNSTLSFAIELLVGIRRAALAERRVAVVEVLGRESGWLALQSGIAALADAVLLPEIRYDPAQLGQHLTDGQRRRPALVVVAEGARPLVEAEPSVDALENTRRALSPGSSPKGTSGGRRVIDRSGAACTAVADCLQRQIRLQCVAFALAPLLRTDTIGAVDRQAGLAYGAAAVRGLTQGHSGTMVAFRPPRVDFVPMADAINAVRTVAPDSEFVVTARTLGISLGD
jgi:ATP-dependent phosphofructokinase / diphosphate-dependent phosphofructokinase